MHFLHSVFGIITLIALAFALSSHRSQINWLLVSKTLILLITITAFVLYIPVGQHVLDSVSNGVSYFLSFANEGSKFVFGDLGDNGFIFALHVLPTIIFMSAVIAFLYHIGVMKFLISTIGGGLHRFLGTSKIESIAASGNIFLSQSESPLLIKPYLNTMSRSELFTVMTCGMASVAGSVLGGYAALGIELKYLLAASFMAAPAGLLMAKIIVPETSDHSSSSDAEVVASEHANALDALADGAMNGVKVAVAVGTMLLAFVAIIAFVNTSLSEIALYFGFEGITLQTLLGYVFYPLGFVIGVPEKEIFAVASYIGQKITLNEFVAFIDFTQNKDMLSERSQILVTFALCGFANLGSIAIQIGAIGALSPERRPEISKLGFKALLAATLANLLSATLAGAFLA
ncbi:NupC/NupG family nucleoside CNT transporter [Vibrio sp.]|nr:NupC/NupG family nucleoside CNT transporter [Vibrio sp.]